MLVYGPACPIRASCSTFTEIVGIHAAEAFRLEMNSTLIKEQSISLSQKGYGLKSEREKTKKILGKRLVVSTFYSYLCLINLIIIIWEY